MQKAAVVISQVKVVDAQAPYKDGQQTGDEPGFLRGEEGHALAVPHLGIAPGTDGASRREGKAAVGATAARCSGGGAAFLTKTVAFIQVAATISTEHNSHTLSAVKMGVKGELEG